MLKKIHPLRLRLRGDAVADRPRRRVGRGLHETPAGKGRLFRDPECPARLPGRVGSPQRLRHPRRALPRRRSQASWAPAKATTPPTDSSPPAPLSRTSPNAWTSPAFGKGSRSLFMWTPAGPAPPAFARPIPAIRTAGISNPPPYRTLWYEAWGAVWSPKCEFKYESN